VGCTLEGGGNFHIASSDERQEEAFKVLKSGRGGRDGIRVGKEGGEE
jgi:hypothetical protein